MSEPNGQPSEPAQPPAARRLGALSPEELIALNEQIAAMARAGLPLDQGLAALARDLRRGRLQKVTGQIAEDLKAGRTLPEALERQAGRLPEFYAGLVLAGVRSGRVADVLATLTYYGRLVSDLRSTVIGAFFYPAIVLLFALGLFTFVSLLIVPQCLRILQDFGIRMPFASQVALEFGLHPFRYLVIPLGALIGGIALVRFAVGGTGAGRVAWARFLYSIPLVGELIRSARMASFTELLAILVDHAVPLPEALRLAGMASSDPLVSVAAQHIEQDISEGAPLGAALRKRRLVPELVAWITSTGERRGALSATLRQAAEIYRRQVTLRSALLRGVLSPLLILVTAALVGAVFGLGLFLPMISLISNLSG